LTDEKTLKEKQTKLQVEVRNMEAAMRTKIEMVRASMARRMAKPGRAEWKSEQMEKDGRRGLTLIAMANAERVKKLASAYQLVAPQMKAVVGLFQKAGAQKTKKMRDLYFKKAAELFERVEKVRRTALAQTSVDEAMMKKIKSDKEKEEAVYNALLTEVTYLKGKIAQMQGVIDQSAGDKKVTAKLDVEMMKDKDTLQKKKEALSLAHEKLRFTKLHRLKPLVDAAELRKVERKKAIATYEDELSILRKKMRNIIEGIWGADNAVNVQRVSAAGLREIAAARVDLIPGQPVPAPPPPPSVAPKIPPKKPPVKPVPKKPAPTAAPAESELSLMKKTGADVQRLNAALSKQLTQGQGLSKSVQFSQVDKIESGADKAAVQALKSSLDCGKYPLLCQVGKPKPPAIAPPAPGKPAPPSAIEVARKLMHDQSTLASQAQKELAALLKKPSFLVEPGEEDAIRNKLAGYVNNAMKARIHLKALEEKRVEVNAEARMKNAKVVVDKLSLKLEALQSEAAPSEKTLDKMKEKLKVAEEFYEDARDDYARVLDAKAANAKSEMLRRVAKVAAVKAKMMSSKFTKELKAELDVAQAAVEEQKYDSIRIAAAIKTVGPPRGETLWVPSGSEERDMDTLQKKLMRQAITKETMSVIKPNGE
jgi:hypothetical protein